MKKETIQDYCSAPLDDLGSWLIVHAMVEYEKKHPVKFKSEDKVTMRLGDVELNPAEFLDDIGEQLDYMVAEKAKKLLQDKFSNLSFKFNELDYEINKILGLRNEL